MCATVAFHPDWSQTNRLQSLLGKAQMSAEQQKKQRTWAQMFLSYTELFFQFSVKLMQIPTNQMFISFIGSTF